MKTFPFSKIDFVKLYLFQFEELELLSFGPCQDWLVR